MQTSRNQEAFLCQPYNSGTHGAGYQDTGIHPGLQLQQELHVCAPDKGLEQARWEMKEGENRESQVNVFCANTKAVMNMKSFLEPTTHYSPPLSNSWLSCLKRGFRSATENPSCAGFSHAPSKAAQWGLISSHLKPLGVGREDGRALQSRLASYQERRDQIVHVITLKGLRQEMAQEI